MLQYQLNLSASEKADIRLTPDLTPAGKGPRLHVLSVSAGDYSGKLSSLDMSIYIDTTPPQISAEVPEEVPEDSALSLSASITDDYCWVHSAELFYELSDGSFTSVLMEGTETEFSTVLPAGAEVWDGMSVFIRAYDSVGNWAESDKVVLHVMSGSSDGGVPPGNDPSNGGGTIISWLGSTAGLSVLGLSLSVLVISLSVLRNNTVIRAPFGGIVTAKTAQPGEMISPIPAGGGFARTGIGTIVDMDSLEIQVDVNEAFINRVAPGQPVEATLNAYPDWKIPASVIAIIPTADRSKATVKVRIAITRKDPRIVPDMGVRVGFLEAPSARAATSTPPGVLVPAQAVRGDGAAGGVFVYQNGTVARRARTVGRSVGGSRHVPTGVREGERVVLSPSESLRDGDAVRLAEGS